MSNYRGFAVFEVMLATVLTVGLILLAMHAISTYRSHDAAEQNGQMLATVLSAAIIEDPVDRTNSPLVSSDNADLAESGCNNANALLNDVSSNYLDALIQSGLNVCTATISVETITP